MFAVKWRVAVFFACAAAIAAFYLAPAPSVPSLGFSHADKVEHAAAYGLLTFCAAGWFRSILRKSLAAAIAAFSVSTMYGAAMEIAQATLTTTRTAEVWDVAADAAGALAAAAFFLFRERDR